MKEKINKFDVGIIGGLSGMLGGMLLVVSLNSSNPPLIDHVKTFQRQEKPAVMRLYKNLGADGILVENSEKKGEYILLEPYLLTIKNKLDRKIEEAEIKKAVKWYEE